MFVGCELPSILCDVYVGKPEEREGGEECWVDRDREDGIGGSESRLSVPDLNGLFEIESRRWTLGRGLAKWFNNVKAKVSQSNH